MPWFVHTKVCQGFELCVMLVLSGCGGPGGPKTVPAFGSVTYQGQPVAMGMVAFVSTDPSGKIRSTSAEIKDGKYKTEPGRGVMVGDYKVAVIAYKNPPTDFTPAVPEKYMKHQTTDLKVSVAEKDREVSLDLKLAD